MGKATSYNILDNLHGNIEFNVRKEVLGIVKYIPMRINLDGVAKTLEGGKLGVKEVKEIGTLSDSPLEGKDLYNTLPSWAQPILKDLYQQAINLDVTV